MTDAHMIEHTVKKFVTESANINLCFRLFIFLNLNSLFLYLCLNITADELVCRYSIIDKKI